MVKELYFDTIKFTTIKRVKVPPLIPNTCNKINITRNELAQLHKQNE